MAKSSWQAVHQWYHENVGAEGHYYHQHVILPNILKHLKGSEIKVADLACGQGVLGRKIDPKTPYVGYDVAPDLIRLAKMQDVSPKHKYFVHDLDKPLKEADASFTHAACILAVQNIENTEALFHNAYALLEKNGVFLMVLNHPCFRIPRQSSWGIEEEKKIQYRRVDRYLTPMNIPIQTNPGKGGKSSETWSFHQPLSFYLNLLIKQGFQIEAMEEWISNKESTGKQAKMENRARSEIPLFLFLKAKKG